MQDSLFTKIIKGEIPSHKIYEDEKTLAFLNVYPSVEGHVLVVPKIQVEFLWDLSSEDYAALMDTTRKVALHLREAMGVPYVGEKVIGVHIPHAHIHLLPFTHASEYYQQETTDEPDHDKLAALAEKLRF